jgi:GDP-mannose 6-dehydrogenase
LENCIESVLSIGAKKVGLFGLTFKEGTDDLRESPAVELAETLIGKGMELSIYEPTISPHTIHGTNLKFIEDNIPHIWKLLTTDLVALMRNSAVIVFLKKLSEQERASLKILEAGQTCIDFVGALRKEELRARIIVFAVPQTELMSASVAAD